MECLICWVIYCNPSARRGSLHSAPPTRGLPFQLLTPAVNPFRQGHRPLRWIIPLFELVTVFLCAAAGYETIFSNDTLGIGHSANRTQMSFQRILPTNLRCICFAVGGLVPTIAKSESLSTS